ncbi:MAG: polysaccharide deacetylase family protein [Desulfurivibrio sp.]|nr:polysaccharide deacetylase family protein [Desulfurivibrio sp.]
MKPLFSIHDVFPETLESILHILEVMESHGLSPAPLLVSPGGDWTPQQLQTLRSLADRGHALVGHGWYHRARKISGLRHRLHSLLISRQAAEHLDLSSDELITMLRRCHAWFPAQGLPAPRYYVPPAWGVGRLSKKNMHQLPFRYIETLTGIYDIEAGTFTHLPLLGFEADTLARKIGLTIFNAINLALAGITRRPVRVAIHPHDLDLKLNKSLRKFLAGFNPKIIKS